MNGHFEILINTAPEIIQDPPSQFRHLNVMYAPFGVRAGDTIYPGPIWCDFAGIWLFRWYEAVWRLSEHKSRAARLPFWYRYEVWLRRTPKQCWKVSFVERLHDRNVIKDELLVIPERVEAELLTCTQRLLAAARRVGRWTEDCAALERLIDDPATYLGGLNSGAIPLPRFLTMQFSIPVPSEAAWEAERTRNG